MLIVSYKISLQDLIYYFFHLTTLKHLKDLNIMFLHYLLLLLNISYTILRMEHNCTRYYFMFVRMIKCYNFNSEHYTKCGLHNVISLFSQKYVYFLQETGVNICVLYLLSENNKTYLVILSDHFYIKCM
jgi:hypothetical protein